MQIVQARPPNYDEIVRAFDIEGHKGMIFAWGTRIYNPDGMQLSSALLAHEAVHGIRQGQDDESIKAWWDRYLVEPAFRLEEELLSHRVEYQAFCKTTNDRNRRARYLHYVAGRLQSPIYGGIISFGEAVKSIRRLDA